MNIDHNTKPKKKNNISPELTHLALNSQPKNTKKSPHEIVQDFFLINDSTTVATELPVFIRPKEVDLDIDEPITGHIDLIQIRYDNLYILDYITRALPEVKGGTRSCASRTSTDRNDMHPNFSFTSAESRTLSKESRMLILRKIAILNVLQYQKKYTHCSIRRATLEDRGIQSR